MQADPEVERERIEALEKWRADRDQPAVDAALAKLAEVAEDDSQNIMPATTGEWSQTLRDAFGDYRGPTGVGGAAASMNGNSELLTDARAKVNEVSEAIGHRIKILVGKPGLDGHSNGAEQIAVRARDVGMEVIYAGIRLTPEQIVASAIEEDVDVIGLSILSGSHRELVPEVTRLLEEAGSEIPVVVGGIIPPVDERKFLETGIARVYTPKDFEVNRIMSDICDLVAERNGITAVQPA